MLFRLPPEVLVLLIPVLLFALDFMNFHMRGLRINLETLPLDMQVDLLLIL